MKYIRTKNGIITNNKATHELIKDIVDAGYYKTLKKGSLVKIGRTWDNFYGRWTTILDINGNHYDINPNEVNEVLKELKQADTIEELCDEYMVIASCYRKPRIINKDTFEKYRIQVIVSEGTWLEVNEIQFLGTAIYTDKGLIYVAKMNDKGELELL